MRSRPLLLSAALLASILAAPVSATPVGPGDVSGTWSPAQNPFVVEGHITVPAGETLEIQPGVQVRFAGHYVLAVEGALQAVGALGDSIHFVPDTPGTPWGHIEFADGAQPSTLSYCVVAGASALGNTFPYSDHGGGVKHSQYVSLGIDNSRIEWCEGANGGGVYGGNGLSLENCVIQHCRAPGSTLQGRGGGAYLENSASITYCIVRDNVADFVGGGVNCFGWGGEITHCTIKNNAVDGHGGGVAFDGIQSGSTFHSNLVIGNDCGTESYSDGGGLYFWYGGAMLAANTIAFNTAPTGAGLSYGHATLNFEQMLIAFNEGGASADINDTSTVEFWRTCTWGNVDDELHGSESETLYEDPLFCNGGDDDYSLCADSPCLPLGIGALGQGCEACLTVTETTSWGRVKSLY